MTTCNACDYADYRDWNPQTRPRLHPPHTCEKAEDGLDILDTALDEALKDQADATPATKPAPCLGKCDGTEASCLRTCTPAPPPPAAIRPMGIEATKVVSGSLMTDSLDAQARKLHDDLPLDHDICDDTCEDFMAILDALRDVDAAARRDERIRCADGVAAPANQAEQHERESGRGANRGAGSLLHH